MIHDLTLKDQLAAARTVAAPVHFSPSGGRRSTRLFGRDLVNASRDGVAEDLVNRATLGIRTVVNFVNAHCVNVAAHDRTYGEALEQADALLPDGSGMRIAARLCGQHMGDNLNGTDLFPELCARAAYAGISIFLLGGAPGVAAAAGAEMKRRYPALRIAGTRDGFFTDSETVTLIDTINASGAGMLFVGMGVPRQETWIAQQSRDLETPILLGVGGLFDYYSGRIPRAPVWVRRLGCEWAWRLAQEPSRLAGRYLLGNGAFLGRTIVEAVHARGIARALSAGAKRTLDLAGAVMTLMLLCPIFLVVWAAIKIEDDGPILFRQTRIGRNGKPFLMLKFRSMTVDAENRRDLLLNRSERDSVCFKMKRDPRITRVGRWMRRLSIDEMPQLINVVRGDMSLVGPRPALPSEVITYADQSWERLRGKPGMTCTWQVSGRAIIPFEEQVRMDIAYLRTAGVWTDLSLLVRTVPAVIIGRGAY